MIVSTGCMAAKTFGDNNMKTFTDVEIIVDDGEINYNYRGVLYTKEQFEEKFLHSPEKKINGYILKTNSKSEGVCYYMNIICITGDKECAEVFPTREAAEATAGYFKQMFHYEDVTVEIEEV